MGGPIVRDVMRGQWAPSACSVLFMLVSTIGYAVAVPLAGRTVDDLLAGADARAAVLGALVAALAGCLAGR